MTSHSAADSHEIRGLTGIRGFAAILVVTLHYSGGWYILFPWLRIASNAIGRGGLGVDLFFVLSGFILGYVYNVGVKKLTWPAYGKFLLFRLARIYPNHLATLLFVVFIVEMAPKLGVAPGSTIQLSQWPYELTLTQTWPFFPGETGESWNFPAWSLSAEWFAYLAIFPVMGFVSLRIRNAWWALFLGCGAMIFWNVYSNGTPNGMFFNIDFSSWSQLVRVSCEFFAGGMFFSAFLLDSPVKQFCQKYLTGLFLLLFGLAFGPSSPWIEGSILMLFPFLLLGLTSEESLAGRLFSTPPILWLGRISYAIYMSHGIAEKFTKVGLSPQSYAHASLIVRIAVWMGHVSIVLLMGALLYYLVEVPGRNLVRNAWFFFKGRRA